MPIITSEESDLVHEHDQSQAPNYSTNHEYVLVYAKSRVTRRARQEQCFVSQSQVSSGHGIGRSTESRLSLVRYRSGSYAIRTAKIEFREEIEAQGLEWEDDKGNDPWKGLFNYSMQNIVT